MFCCCNHRGLPLGFEYLLLNIFGHINSYVLLVYAGRCRESWTLLVLVHDKQNEAVHESNSTKKLLSLFRAMPGQFERYYNVTDKSMLGWDRVVGNLLEQAMPFLTLFWVNIGLAALGATDYAGVAIAGWVYVIFRALYVVSRYHAPCQAVV